MNYLDSLRFLLKCIASVVPISIIIYGIIKENYVVVMLIVSCLFAIFAIYSIFHYLAFYKGVFAVSAIIMNNRHEILLINDEKEEIYKQPGGHYKTNKFAFRKKLITPYEYILKIIEEETRIEKEYLKIIDFGDFKEEKEINDRFPNISNKFKKYGKNIISFAPIYVLYEKSDNKKSSGEKFHIDFFYAFKIDDDIILGNNMKFFSVAEMDGLNTHKDLVLVCNDVIKRYKKMKYPISNIRFCTFSNSAKKIYWRITKNCNANCNYCISKSGKTKDKHKFTDTEIDTIINYLKEEQYEKIIITGGEPFMLAELPDIVGKLANQLDDCKEISICTNATEWSSDYIEKLFDIEKINKYVISIDACNEHTYCRLKALDNRHGYLTRALTFIKQAKEKGKDITINVMISRYFLQHIQEYVKFWCDKNFTDISLSNPVFSNEELKHKALEAYNKILNGDYGDMSFCDNLELILSDCDHQHCPMSKSIHAIDILDIKKHCLEASYK